MIAPLSYGDAQRHRSQIIWRILWAALVLFTLSFGIVSALAVRLAERIGGMP